MPPPQVAAVSKSLGGSDPQRGRNPTDNTQMSAVVEAQFAFSLYQNCMERNAQGGTVAEVADWLRSVTAQAADYGASVRLQSSTLAGLCDQIAAFRPQVPQDPQPTMEDEQWKEMTAAAQKFLDCLVNCLYELRREVPLILNGVATADKNVVQEPMDDYLRSVVDGMARRLTNEDTIYNFWDPAAVSDIRGFVEHVNEHVNGSL